MKKPNMKPDTTFLDGRPGFESMPFHFEAGAKTTILKKRFWPPPENEPHRSLVTGPPPPKPGSEPGNRAKANKIGWHWVVTRPT